MTRTAYDAIASLSHNIPTNAQIVMGYVSPSGFAWSPADWARFPNSVHVRITPSAATTGVGIHMLDVERGDATPAQSPGWALTQRRLGQIPTVYCSASLWQTVQDAFTAAGVAQPLYVIAAYPGGGAVLPTLNGITAVGHQYQSTAIYDLSVVADFWPGVDEGGLVTTPNDIWMAPCHVRWNAGSPQARLAIASGATANADGSVDETHPAVDWLTAVSGRVAVLAGQLPALAAQLTAEQAALVATIQAGGVDVKAFAAALAPVLAPLLPADVTPQQVADAVRAELATVLAVPPAGGAA